MPRFARTLLLLAGVVVLAVLVRRAGVAAIIDLLGRVGWSFAVVSSLYTVHVAFRALALWRSLPAPLVRYRDVLRVRLSVEAVETLTLTGPFLAEPAKGWLLMRRGLSGVDAYAGVALEYLLYTVISSWMAAASLSLLLARGALPHALRAPVAGIVVALAAFTVAFVAAAVTGIGLIVPIVRGAGVLLGRDRALAAAARLDPVERVLVDVMHRRPGRLAEVLAIEAAGHALLALEIWVVVRALALPAAPIDALIVEGAVKFIGAAFFFVPGQIGASEAVYTLLFQALGLPVAAGLTLALVRRVRGLVVAGAGLLVL
jgi:hypothetical protein